MKRIFVIAAVSAAISLTGCGAMNAYTGAAINAGEASYAGAKQNLQAIDDAKFIGWTNLACAMPIGALQRNATGNPDAIQAVLTACPIPNLAVVNTKNGTVNVVPLPVVTAPTPVAGYAAPASGVAK